MEMNVASNIQPTGKELFFERDEIIVSKTNPKGHITYANDVFMRLAGYSEREILGAPHSIIRHPHMPRCIFKLLWDTLKSKKEIFAYVMNMSATGDHYWVLAHVTPTFDGEGNVTSYHSNRRLPNRKTLDEIIIPLYKQLLDEEQKYPNKKEGMQKSFEMLTNLIDEKGKTYDEFILSL